MSGKEGRVFRRGITSAVSRPREFRRGHDTVAYLGRAPRHDAQAGPTGRPALVSPGGSRA